ncbi:MAG: YdeI family protein [bacterium]
MNQLYFATIKQWHQWLVDNHDTAESVWLEFHKPASSKKSLSYSEALDEALCFGWIDSIIKRIDDKVYLRKFSRRNPKSRWSQVNKNKVDLLIKSGRMTEAGYAIIQIAKSNGCYDKPEQRPVITKIPPEFQIAMDKNSKAKQYFDTLAPTYRMRYIMWIATAKKQETKDKRIIEAIKLLSKHRNLGLK